MHRDRDDDGAGTADGGSAPDLDLVEYVVISVPELSAAVGVAAALKQLVESGQIRILDLVGVYTGPDGRFTVIEPELMSGLAALENVEGEVGGLLSEDDIALASGALPRRHVGPDDRGRGPLGPAAGRRRAGRWRHDHRRRADSAAPARAVPTIPRRRTRTDGGAVVKRVASSRRRHVDLLRRRPEPGVGAGGPARGPGRAPASTSCGRCCASSSAACSRPTSSSARRSKVFRRPPSS